MLLQVTSLINTWSPITEDTDIDVVQSVLQTWGRLLEFDLVQVYL